MPVPDTDLQYVCALLLFHPHTVGIPAAVGPSLNIWALGAVWPANSPTAALSFCLLIA